jgi:hypothetical protein
MDYQPSAGQMAAAEAVDSGLPLPVELEDRILALDAEHLTETDVAGVLSNAPAPRIVQIHGGRWPVYKQMVSFGKFLEGMGYPESRLRSPRDGTYSFSSYMSSRKIAGAIAWYYEREGLRPMLIGHSLGGFQVVRVLHLFSDEDTKPIPVWNPLTGEPEERFDIVDPLTHERRSVTDLSVCFAFALGAGGLTWVMPPTWSLAGRLRDIPESTDAFTGYFIGMDWVGGDWAGFGPANHYHTAGDVRIRNVQLPTGTPHGTAPAAEHLLSDEAMVDWINQYTPTNRPRVNASLPSNSKNLPFAADAWHDIRKHWVLELQRVIRAGRDPAHEP